MAQLSSAIAAKHDHWFEEPAAKHVLPALKLWLRHFSKQHPIAADAIEWSAGGMVAVAVVAGTLVANA
jgi:hypothetical protein